MSRTILGLVVAASVAGSGREAGAQIDPRSFESPPAAAAFPVNQVPDLARMLDDESSQFVPAVRRELGGTPQGRQLVIRGNALRSTARAFTRTLQVGGDPNQLGIWRDQFVQSLNAVQSELNDPPGTAPVSAAIAQRMGRLAFEINRAMAGDGQPSPLPNPGGFPPGPGQGGGFQALQLVQAAATQLDATNGFLAADIGQAPPFDGAMLDLQALSVGMQQLNQIGLAGGGPQQMSATLLPLWVRVRRVNALMQGGLPQLARARASWMSAVGSLSGLAQMLGIPPDLTPPPNVGPPNILPTPNPPIGPGPGFGVSPAVALADQLGGEVEGFLVAVQPNALRIPQGLQFIADARILRGAVIAFRQAAAAGAPPTQLQPAFAQLNQAYANLLNRINRIAGFRSGPNIDRVRRMGLIVDQIRASMGF